MIRVVIYCRVSTEEQAEEGYSLQAQIDQAKEYCKRTDKQFVKAYSDKGISGKSTKDRLALNDLLEDCSKDIFDEVVVWKTSRLARNVLDLSQIVDTFQRCSVAFRSLSEPYETSTPQGKLMMNMLASFAEFERTTIIENLKMGMNARARQGYKNGGRMLGYKSKGSGKDSELVIVEDEAKIVRIIFDMYSNGKGYKAISNYLNHQDYKTVKGNPFSTYAVKDILENPTYIGKIRFNRFVDYSHKRRKGKNEDHILVDGRHEPIIDQLTWDRVRLIQKNKGGKRDTKSRGKFPLTGILRCPVCGAGMVSANSGHTRKDGTRIRHRFYVCGNFHNKGSKVCRSNSVRAETAEQYVYRRIREVLSDDKLLKQMVKKMNDDNLKKSKPLEKERDDFKKSIKELTGRRNRVFELYEDGIIDKITLRDRIEVIEGELTKKESCLASVSSELSFVSKEKIPFQAVKDVLIDFHELLETAEQDKRKLILKLVVDEIKPLQGKVDRIYIQFDQTIKGLIESFKEGQEAQSVKDSGSFSYVFKMVI